MLRLYLTLGWMKKHSCGYSNPTDVSILILLMYSARQASYYCYYAQVYKNMLVAMVAILISQVYKDVLALVLDTLKQAIYSSTLTSSTIPEHPEEADNTPSYLPYFEMVFRLSFFTYFAWIHIFYILRTFSCQCYRFNFVSPYHVCFVYFLRHDINFYSKVKSYYKFKFK